METFISLAANELKVKQRVAVNTEAGWFIGTVKLVKTKYATVKFDDGDIAEVPKLGTANDFRVLPSDTPVSKKAYKANEIRAMLQNTAKKESVKVKNAVPAPDNALDDKHSRNVVEPQAPKLPPVPKMRVIGQRPIEQAPNSNTQHETKPPVEHMTNDDPVEQLRIVYEGQIRASTNVSAIRRFMLDLWNVFNKTKFDNKLRPVKKFLIIPAQGRMGLRAFWHSKYRILVFTNLVMKANWDKFREIFLHELCHQAVTDVEYGGKPHGLGPEGGHGPDWQAWMRKVGLEPNRYDNSTFSEYMTEEEKALFEENADNAMSTYALNVVRKKDHYDRFKEAKLVRVKNAQVGSFITLSDGTTEEPAEGVVVAVKGNGEYGLIMYTDELRGKEWLVDENDPERPLYFIRDPKIKYRALARRMAEAARREARKHGLMR
jgi:predicted SprT family Zn-dependent metalloprotease